MRILLSLIKYENFVLFEQFLNVLLQKHEN